MSVFRCPGSETIRNAVPEELPCPACGRAVEIWADEAEAVCAACGGKVSRRPPVSCWRWCSAARDCLGPERYERLSRGWDRDKANGNYPAFISNRRLPRAGRGEGGSDG